MKKMLLGLTALSSVAALAATSGYVNSKVVLETNKAKEVKEFTTSLEGKTHFGVYINEGKDLLLFAGLEGKNNELGKGEVLDSKLAYLGARLDTKLSNNVNLEVTAGHKFLSTDKDSFKNHILKHLEAKGHLVKDAKDDVKDKALRDHGYLKEEDKTTLLSTVLSGKAGATDLRFVSMYTGANFETNKNKVETFGRANHKFNKADVELELTHVYDEAVDSKENAGELKGHLLVKSDKLVKDLEVSTKNSFELVSGILSKDGNRVYSLGTENKVKYTGIDKFELTGEVNYGFYNNKVLTLATDGKVDAILNDYLHTPTIKFGVKYTEDKLTLSSNNEHDSYVFLKLHDVKKEGHVSEAAKQISVNNTFKTDNKVEYKVNDMLTAKAFANYRLDYDTVNKNPFLYTHYILTGLGLDAKYDKDMLKLESNSEVSHLFVKLGNTKGFNLFAHSNNKLEYKVNDKLMLNANLNAHNYLFTDKYNANRFVLNMLKLNPGVKATYKENKLTLTSDLQVNYLNVYTAYNTDSEKDNKLTLVSNSEAKYSLLSNVEAMLGFKVDYNYNGYNNDNVKKLVEYVENKGLKENDYYVDNTLNSDVQEMIKNYKGELRSIAHYVDKEKANASVAPVAVIKHSLELTPSLGATFKYYNDKLVITPKASATFTLNGEGTDTNKVKYRNFKGELSLNVDYTW